MGVYINMEMPKSCGYCFALDDYGDYPVCQITKEQRGYKFPVAIKRMDNCPLVPVPPHGRCVDADKLMQEMRLFIKENMLSRDDARELLETIEDAPTVLEEEEGEA